MRLIDADALIRTMRADPLYFVVERYNIEGPIHAAPTIDAIPVIRCKDCKHFLPGENPTRGWCALSQHGYPNADDYCSDAERKEE